MKNSICKRTLWVALGILVLIGIVLLGFHLYNRHHARQLAVFSPFQKEYTGFALETPLETGGASVKVLVNGEKNGLGEFRGSIRITRDGNTILHYESCTVTCTDDGDYLFALEDNWTPDADHSKPNTIWGNFHADPDWTWLVLQPLTETGRDELQYEIFVAPAANREAAIAVYNDRHS